MKRILDFLGLTSSETAAGTRPAAVGQIVEELSAFDANRADFLAAFAYLLGRAAHADLDISADEVRKMEEIVEEYGDLPPEQARIVVEIARRENELWGGTQNFQVAREFRRLASRDERRELLHCLFAVAAADDSISGSEEKQLRHVAEELGFSHREYIEVRSHYNDQRSVVRRARGQGR